MNWKNGYRIMIVLIILYLLLLGVVYALQKYIIFHPSKLPDKHQFQFDGPFEEVFISVEEKTHINGLYFPTQKVRKGVVLYFHGNAGDLQSWGHIHPIFTERGYDLLITDYRSFGKTPGPIIDEATFYSDARAVYDWLRNRFAPEEIIIYGRSLGTAVAAQLASKVEARQLILETPFDKIRGIIQKKAPFVFLPFKLPFEFRNDEFLKTVSCPTYIFQGTKDQIVDFSLAEKLKPFLSKEGDFITIEGAGHNDLANFERYHRQLDILLGIDEE